MKLTLLTLATGFLSSVLADPILGPCGFLDSLGVHLTDTFKLRTISKSGTFVYPMLQVQAVVNGGYSRYGWFAKNAQDAVLNFSGDCRVPGAVIDPRRNGERMQTQWLFNDAGNPQFRVLLMGPGLHGLTGLYTLEYYAESGLFRCDDPGTWFACHKKVAAGQESSLDAELYHGITAPVSCGRADEVSLQLVGSLVDQVTAAVGI